MKNEQEMLRALNRRDMEREQNRRDMERAEFSAFMVVGSIAVACLLLVLAFSSTDIAMTHELSRKRREEVLSELRDGATVKELSEKYGLARSTVTQYRYLHGISAPPSKAKQLAAYVEEHGTEGIREEIDRLGIRRYYASSILRSMGYEIPRNKTTNRKVRSSKVITIIAALQRGATANDKWAKKFNCTRQYIEQVQRQCEQEGVILSSSNAKAEARHE